MDPKLEHRMFRLDQVELREDGPLLLVGHAAVFDTPEEIYPGLVEEVAPGTFRRAIVEDDIRALWNHDSNWVLGRNRAGTLVLAEDDTGLRVEIKVPDTQWARDLMVSIRRGDVSQMSFGFVAIKQEFTQLDGNRVKRRLEDVQLMDVSPVTYPAYPTTDIQARSLEQVLAAGRESLVVVPAAPSGLPSDLVRKKLELMR